MAVVAATAQARLLQAERRDLAEPTLLPEREDEERRDDRDAERDPVAPAPRDEVRERRADAHEQVRRLHRRQPRRARSPASTASCSRCASSERTTKTAAGEHEHHRRVVRHRRQAECLREELLARSAPGSGRRRAGSMRTARSPRETTPSSRGAVRRSGSRGRRRREARSGRGRAPGARRAAGAPARTSGP